MSRLYGKEQRQAAIDLSRSLIDNLDDTYKKAFDGLKSAGLGEGMIIRLTQVFLMSRHEAIGHLDNEIKELNVRDS